ncbi:sulfatase [Schlesneria sp.]|uniref:sulfatase n=1 Tax=Schlesneria sp. TaxID=2762018 RepID=UPI002F123BA5
MPNCLPHRFLENCHWTSDRSYLVAATLITLIGLLLHPAVASAAKPNVLFIAIDDQNDWIGVLGGHPLAKTPNIDRLAERGTTFLNAHCQAPLCNPSRASLLTGLRPTTTGIYGLVPSFRAVDAWKDRVTLPQHFRQNGYRTLTTGKIFHGDIRPVDGRPPEFETMGPGSSIGPLPPRKLIGPTPMGDHPLMDWGVFPHRDEDKGDYQITSWTVEQIRSAPKDQPFFLATGFFLPHVPCYVTQKWFDLFPDDDRILPLIKPDDRKDTPRFSWYLHWKLPEPRWRWVDENHQGRNLVRSYLACTSFVDSQIGRLIDTIDEAGLRDNTVIVLWSDHGWHLGEKGITGKNSLWERSTRVPLIFAGPGVRPASRCHQPAELLDMYPTLIELCGLPSRHDLEGISLVPQLKDPETKRERPAITSHNQGNHSVRSERWRYIRYADGSEELYDMKHDPGEWHNLAHQPEVAQTITDHRKWLPQKDVAPAPGSAHRILTYDRAADEATWEGTPIQRSSLIPE